MTEPTTTTTTTIEWPVEASRYHLVGKIGQGAFASVWRAGLKEKEDTKQPQQQCAIKVLNLDHIDSNLAEIRMEVQAMRLSSHPNILPCHAAFVKSTDLWLVTQLMRKGSSLHCLKVARRRAKELGLPIPKMEDHILFILHETLMGLQYIHDNGQIHRDIKAGNILIDSDGRIRIADFGVSGWLIHAGKTQEKAQTFVGTPCWMGPEVMEQVNGYDYKADIWSLGITALELAKGYAPYARYPAMKVLIRTIQEDPPSLDTYEEEEESMEYHHNHHRHDMDHMFVEEEFTQNFRQFVDKCLQKNPTKRPKAKELLTSKHLDGFQNETFRNRRRMALVEQVCELVDDVGEDDSSSHTTTAAISMMREQISRGEPTVKIGSNPGHVPISIIMSSTDDGGEGNNNNNNDRPRKPAGTTWVFADGGSQVLSSSSQTTTTTSTKNDHRPTTIDDVMEELDQFGQRTGGEHYYTKPSTTTDTTTTDPGMTAPNSSGNTKEENEEEAAAVVVEEEPDDLNAFMDEFELNTQGENFHRNTTTNQKS